MIRHLFSAAIALSLLNAAPKNVSNSQVWEDTLSLYALDAQMRQKYKRSADFFTELYKQTSNKEYLIQSLKMLEQANDIKTFSSQIATALAATPDDEILKRFEIIVLLKEGKFAEASEKGLLLSQKSNQPPNHLLYGEARLKLGDYAGAVEALNKAYALNYDDTTAERIALIRYTQLGEKKEAIAFLKQHIGTHGNSQVLGKRLGSLYADQGQLDDAARIYEQTYDEYQDSASAEEALKIYLYQQNLSKMTGILEKSHSNDPLLLDIYVKVRSFDKASALAQTLYEREDNPIYLAQSAVFKYEGSADRNNSELLSSVIEGLKKANKDIEEPLYLNYLGYLMIDHDINVSEGVGYVRRALEKQPDSPFYLDSLAWGKYKLGECDEALRLIKQVESMIGSEEDEVREHLKAIEKCIPKEKH